MSTKKAKRRILSTRSTEFRLFLSAFVAYAMLVSYINWNENSRFDLTMAIVDEGRLNIDSFYNNTGDRAVYEGHYYSDKEPGMSLLAVPVYGVYRLFLDQPENQKTPDSLDFSMELIRAISVVTIMTSGLFGALSVVVIYRLLRFYTESKTQQLAIALVYAFGTLVFVYSRLFFNHAVATFFILLSFYLVKRGMYLRAGLSLGFACVVQISLLAAIPVFMIYIYREKPWKFLSGAALGLIPLLVYNYAIFGNPLELAYFHIDPMYWSQQFELRIFSAVPVLFQLLFGMYRGLFVYIPISLLSFVGLYRMKNKDAFFISSLVLIYIAYNTQLATWGGGSCFGPRHLTILMPFLMIPLAKIKPGKIFTILAVLSVLFTVSSANIISDGPYMKYNPWGVEHNIPLLDYYIPNLFMHGPNTMLFFSISGIPNYWFLSLAILAITQVVIWSWKR